MKESGIPLTKTEYDNLFKFFDKNCDDQVSFTEFVGYLRAPLNNRRQAVVDEGWAKISGGQDTVNVAVLT